MFIWATCNGITEAVREVFYSSIAFISFKNRYFEALALFVSLVSVFPKFMITETFPEFLINVCSGITFFQLNQNERMFISVKLLLIKSKNIPNL